MKIRKVLSASLIGPVLIVMACTGCQHSSTPSSGSGNTAAEARAQAQAAAKKVDAARQELDEIPPPAKSRYMVIHTQESWNNPFLIVGSSYVTLRAVSPDRTYSAALPSAMLKPAKARRQELEIRLADLPDALSALPPEDWPYGRVIAVEEDPSETRADRLQVRRNVETTMQVLNNLGVVAYEWPQNGVSR